MQQNANALDLQFISQVHGGDKEAFNPLVIKYELKVLHVVLGYIKDVNEAKDVTQDIFIKAYRALPNFRGDSAFYTWLYRIAINTAKNHLMNQGRRLPDAHAQWYHSEHWAARHALKENDTPEHLALRDEMEHTIDNVIEALPSELRVAFILREMGGLSYDEIADVMNCPLGTVRSRIFRARDAIEKKVDGFL